MRLAVRAAGTYELQDDSFVSLMVEPPLDSSGHHVIEADFETSTVRSSIQTEDLYGNTQRHIIAPRGRFSFEYNATIEVTPNKPLPPEIAEDSPLELSPDSLIYTLPSRYCESDLLARMALTEFGTRSEGDSRVLRVTEWVRSHLQYRYQTTGPTTSARDTAIERIGVCRDFAHLLIAFLRALDIPARYASGYALDLEPPDFHGYVQVYLGGTWHNLDATIDSLRPALVTIAVGRDAADVAIATLSSQHQVIEQSVEIWKTHE